MSNHNFTHCQLLVDRGANGGIYGEGINVINTPPRWHVKI